MVTTAAGCGCSSLWDCRIKRAVLVSVITPMRPAYLDQCSARKSFPQPIRCAGQRVVAEDWGNAAHVHTHIYKRDVHCWSSEVDAEHRLSCVARLKHAHVDRMQSPKTKHGMPQPHQIGRGSYLDLADVAALKKQHQYAADADATTHAQWQCAADDSPVVGKASAVQHATVSELCLHSITVHPDPHRRQLVPVSSAGVLHYDVSIQSPLHT